MQLSPSTVIVPPSPESSISKSHLKSLVTGTISDRLAVEHPFKTMTAKTAQSNRIGFVISPYFFKYIVSKRSGKASSISVGVSESTEVVFTAVSPDIAWSLAATTAASARSRP